MELTSPRKVADLHTLEIHREIKHFASPTSRAKTSFSAISSCYANNNNKKIIRRGEREKKKKPDPFAEERGWEAVGWGGCLPKMLI